MIDLHAAVAAEQSIGALALDDPAQPPVHHVAVRPLPRHMARGHERHEAKSGDRRALVPVGDPGTVLLLEVGEESQRTIDALFDGIPLLARLLSRGMGCDRRYAKQRYAQNRPPAVK